VGLRVNPEVTVDSSHRYIKTGERGAKFGIPFDEIGLQTALQACRHKTSLSTIGADVVQAVERHTAEKRFADDLTILLLRRTTPAPVGV